MGMNKATRHFTAWIASFAVLLSLLAPSISFAAARDAGASWQEICSVGGFKLIKVADGQNPKSSPPVGTATHPEHCPFCFTHAGSFGLPPTVEFSLPVVTGSNASPILFYQSPHPLYIWSTAQSRAPPLFS